MRHREIDESSSASFTSDGMHAAALEMFPSITPELFAGSAIEEAYLRTAPRSEDFPTLVEKLKRLDTPPYAWTAQDIRAIAAPTMIVLGDVPPGAGVLDRADWLLAMITPFLDDPMPEVG